MRCIGLALCKHDNCEKPYLFQMPRYESLKEGDRVIVDTARGQEQATVICAATTITDDEECAMIFALAGVEKLEDLSRVIKRINYRDLVYEEDE